MQYRATTPLLVLVCATASLTAVAAPFAPPVTSPVTQGYGVWNEVMGGYHTGIDYDASDTAVRVAADGVVVNIQTNDEGCSDCEAGTPGTDCADRGMGNTVILEHTLPDGSKVYSLYAHLASFVEGLAEGGCIAQGEQIGTTGGSGYGCPAFHSAHLHFEMKSAAVLVEDSSAARPGYTSNLPDEGGYYNPDAYLGAMEAQSCAVITGGAAGDGGTPDGGTDGGGTDGGGTDGADGSGDGGALKRSGLRRPSSR